jgi:hypothetical protein
MSSELCQTYKEFENYQDFMTQLCGRFFILLWKIVDYLVRAFTETDATNLFAHVDGGLSITCLILY